MKRLIKNIIFSIFRFIPWLSPIFYTRGMQTPCKPWMFLLQKILGFNRAAYWPVHFTSKVSSPESIYSGIDVSPGYMPGCYIYGTAGIYIGDYTQIAANVGIMSGNHDVYDSRKTVDIDTPVVIGNYCWIGMNAVILPQVVLGDHTIVAAGAIVTKSFPEGYCVLAGVPAKVIRSLDREKVVKFKNDYEYNGYIRHKEFEQFRNKVLKIKPYTEIRKQYNLEQ